MPPDGIQPVIEVALNSSKPLLAVGSGVTLKLSGIVILVRYPESTIGAATGPPAVITTMSAARIERCAFKVASGSKPKGSLACPVGHRRARGGPLLV